MNFINSIYMPRAAKKTTVKKTGTRKKKKIAENENLFATLTHLTALTGFFIPLGNFIFPLVIWMVKKNESTLINESGKESLNFQITIALYLLAAIVLCFVLIGFIILPLIPIFSLAMIVIASIKTYEGEVYRYPFAIRLIK